MPTRDPEKNRAYVADYRRRMKENAELKKIYDSANLGYINKFNEKLKNEIGKEQYNEDKNEYMRNYIAKQKQAKQEQEIRGINENINTGLVYDLVTDTLKNNKNFGYQALKANTNGTRHQINILKKINKLRRTKAPTNPNSSPIIAKIESPTGSGK